MTQITLQEGSSALADAQAGMANSFLEVSRTFGGGVEDPYPLFRERRENSPVMEGDILSEFGVPSRAFNAGGARRVFTLYKYADLSRVLRDAATFTSGILAEARPGFLGQGITSLDGEAHRWHRDLFQHAFTPQAVDLWRDEIIGPVVEREIIGPLRSAGRSELLTDVALKFPVRIIYHILGFPDSPEQVDYFAAQALWALTSVQTDPEKTRIALARSETAAAELLDYTLDAVRERRRRGGADNSLIGCLMRASENGESLNDDEIAHFVRGLLPAAAETTARSFGNMMTLLFEHPDQLEALRQDRALASRAVNEAIRYEGPAGFLARQAATDVVLSGVEVPAGSALSLALSSGNRDEEAFPDGDSFDIHRKLKPSLGFGYGPHMCLGMQIAKVEMEGVLNGLLDLPNFRLDTTKAKPRITGLHFRSADAVHVLWN